MYNIRNSTDWISYNKNFINKETNKYEAPKWVVECLEDKILYFENDNLFAKTCSGSIRIVNEGDIIVSLNIPSKIVIIEKNLLDLFI